MSLVALAPTFSSGKFSPPATLTRIGIENFVRTPTREIEESMLEGGGRISVWALTGSITNRVLQQRGIWDGGEGGTHHGLVGCESDVVL